MHLKACVIIVRGLNLKMFKSGTTFYFYFFYFLFSKDCNVIVVILFSIQVLFFPFMTLFFVGEICLL